MFSNLFFEKLTLSNVYFKYKLIHYHLLDHILNFFGGTGMVASSNTFRAHPGGRVIKYLFSLLHAVRLVMEAQIYNTYPKEDAAYTCLAIIFVAIATLGTIRPKDSRAVFCLARDVLALSPKTCSEPLIGRVKEKHS